MTSRHSSQIESHYQALLAARYTWMMGGPERCLQNARELLDTARLPASLSGVALDLGCGGGYHARALAERGLDVVAVDNSEELLRELAGVCAGLKVDEVNGDLSELQRYAARGPFRVILCVGDTLTHLNSEADVGRLINDASRLLAPDGVILLEFREQTRDLPHRDSVLTTRAERDRIMQCVLHFEPDRVWVTDVVHEWDGSAWQTLKSTYPKLRLRTEQIASYAQSAGLRIVVNETRAGRKVLGLGK